MRCSAQESPNPGLTTDIVFFSGIIHLAPVAVLFELFFSARSYKLYYFAVLTIDSDRNRYSFDKVSTDLSFRTLGSSAAFLEVKFRGFENAVSMIVPRTIELERLQRARYGRLSLGSLLVCPLVWPQATEDAAIFNSLRQRQYSANSS
jgi:hypothetical protein